MDNIVTDYLEKLIESLRAREVGDEGKEDELLEDLDQLWLRMVPHQINYIDAQIQPFVDEQITLDALEASIKLMPRDASSVLKVESTSYAP